MLKRLTFSIFMIAVVLAGASYHPTVSAQQAAPYCASGEQVEMLNLINAHRQRHGLAPLTLSQPLGAAAEMKSHDMAGRDYFAHVSPDGQGPVDLLNAVGYTGFTAIGENIAAGNQSAEATFNQWLNSPGHNAIMLSEHYTAIGLGVASNPNSTYGWYWTASFGNPVGTPAGSCAAPAA